MDFVIRVVKRHVLEMQKECIVIILFIVMYLYLYFIHCSQFPFSFFWYISTVCTYSVYILHKASLKKNKLIYFPPFQFDYWKNISCTNLLPTFQFALYKQERVVPACEADGINKKSFTKNKCVLFLPPPLFFTSNIFQENLL